jgi:ABC-type Zn uptake system ZnuABC Zn-binding protein ZnuA
MPRLTVALLSILALLLAGLAGCAALPPAPAAPAAAGSPAAAPASPAPLTPTAVPPSLNVLAVETFLADMAQHVAGDRLQVAALMPIGMDPHAFEPAPQDVARVADSDVLIVNGAGFEGWLDVVLRNAGGDTALVEAAAGLTMREPAEGEAVHADEHQEDDHSVASHSAMVCEQLAGKSAEEAVQAGADAGSAVELHDEHAAETPAPEADHAHEREIITLTLAPAADGSFGGYVLFDAEEEGSYAFTSAPGAIAVTTAAGEPVEVAQELPLDCAGMAQGRVFKLDAGEHLVALTGFAAETTPFSAAPVHGHDHEGEEAHEDEAAHGHSHEGDPHFWLDPVMAITYVENIRAGLSAADPAGADVYAANAAAYTAQLRELDAWIREQVAALPAERRLLVTNHESFGYFADRYGFRIVGTVIPSVDSSASPSAQQLAGLIQHIREIGAPAIFLETGANPQLAEQVGKETGITVITELITHSVTEAGGFAPTYVDMMKHNTQKIIAALQ